LSNPRLEQEQAQLQINYKLELELVLVLQLVIIGMILEVMPVHHKELIVVILEVTTMYVGIPEL
jgi:hypothetical protein